MNKTSDRYTQKTAVSPAVPGRGYFRRVRALPGYRLDIVMETETVIQFDFRSRLETARFGRLRDLELFEAVRTDGNNLIFEKPGKIPVNISAREFMDLVMIDRTKIDRVDLEEIKFKQESF